MLEVLKPGLVPPSPMTFPLHYTSPNSPLLMRKLNPREAQRCLSTSMSASEEEQANRSSLLIYNPAFTSQPPPYFAQTPTVPASVKIGRWNSCGNDGSELWKQVCAAWRLFWDPSREGRTLSGGAKRGGGVGERRRPRDLSQPQAEAADVPRRRWPTFSAAQMPESPSTEAVSRPPADLGATPVLTAGSAAGAPGFISTLSQGWDLLPEPLSKFELWC